MALPKNSTTTVRLRNMGYKSFSGTVEPYFQYYLHFCATKKQSFICSKIWSMNEEGDIYSTGGKCLGCDSIEDGSKNVSKQLLHGINGIHMVWFHEEQVRDKAGKLVSTKDGKPVMDRIPCKGRLCDSCKRGIPKVFGKAIYLAVGIGHLDNLLGFSSELDRTCVCGGALNPVTFGCEHCEAILLDVAECNLDAEELGRWSKSTHKCPTCGQITLAIPELECDSCSEPRPLEIFDVDMDMKKHGEGPKSVIQVPRWKYKELSEELEKLDMPRLDKVLVGADFEWQAKCLGIDNPYREERAREKSEDHSESYDEENTVNDGEVPF